MQWQTDWGLRGRMAFTGFLPTLALLGIDGPGWLPAWLGWCGPLAALWRQQSPSGSPSRSATWSEPITIASGKRAATVLALDRASRCASARGVSPGNGVSSTSGACPASASAA